MTLQTALLATLIIILGAAQYALCAQAIHDLARRPRVRGDNKVLWGLAIFCLPIAGAILYNWMGPTSFIHRPVSALATDRDHGAPPPATRLPAATITPISAARSARRRRVAEATHTPAPRKRATPTAIGKVRRTGS